MKRICAIAVWCAFFQVIVPAHAHAWWDFIEELSGAGPWKGFDIEGRLVCFVHTGRREALGKTGVAERQLYDLTHPKPTTKPGDPEPRAPTAADWQDLKDLWKEAMKAWETVAGDWAYRAAETKQQAIDKEAGLTPPQAGNAAAHEAAAVAYQRAVEDAQKVAEERARTYGDKDVRAFMVPGLLYSACALKPGERRRASIDLGMRFVWTRNDDRFAGGQRISMTTLEPTFSWSIINSPKYDVLEYGLGAGMYWVSSKAFPSFNGGFLEPVRIDIHAPTIAPWPARLFVFRAGLLVFPGGFEPDAFAARPDVAHRISRDWVKTYGVYADLELLLRKLNKLAP